VTDEGEQNIECAAKGLSLPTIEKVGGKIYV
jgi:hypothetical protein